MIFPKFNEDQNSNNWIVHAHFSKYEVENYFQ